MNPFKVGDTVVCVNSSLLVMGKEYVVSKIPSEHSIYLEGVEDWYNHWRFKLVKRAFDMKTQPWFIRVNNEEEFGVVADFLEAKGFRFYEKKYTKSTQAIGNSDLAGNIERDSGVSRLMMSEIEKVIHHGGKEIKMNFKKIISIDSVDYPEVKSTQQVEIEQIETEMRKLADRLNKLKGE